MLKNLIKHENAAVDFQVHCSTAHLQTVFREAWIYVDEHMEVRVTTPVPLSDSARRKGKMKAALKVTSALVELILQPPILPQ